MSRVLELVLCALVPLALSAFSAPRDITPDDELNAISESRIVDDDVTVIDLAGELDHKADDSGRSA